MTVTMTMTMQEKQGTMPLLKCSSNTLLCLASFFLEQTLVKSAIPVTEQGVHLATWTKLIFGKYFSYFSLQNCCWNPRIYLLSSAKF